MLLRSAQILVKRDGFYKEAQKLGDSFRCCGFHGREDLVFGKAMFTRVGMFDRKMIAVLGRLSSFGENPFQLSNSCQSFQLQAAFLCVELKKGTEGLVQCSS